MPLRLPIKSIHISLQYNSSSYLALFVQMSCYSFVFQVSKDGSVTASLMCHVVEDLETLLPAISEVHLFSDNAGYKNTNYAYPQKPAWN